MTTSRSIADSARDITIAWPRPYFAAAPYLQAMLTLDSSADDYGHDNARSIVLYVLRNAAQCRGPEAKTRKAELKSLLK